MTIKGVSCRAAVRRFGFIVDQDNVRVIQSGDRPPTVEDLHCLPYTLQVIKEVLRLYPPAPFDVRDAASSGILDEYAIPAGSAVMLSPYYTHCHPDF